MFPPDDLKSHYYNRIVFKLYISVELKLSTLVSLRGPVTLAANPACYHDVHVLHFKPGVFFTGFTGGCLLDNLQCVRRRESRRGDDVFVSANNHRVF